MALVSQNVIPPLDSNLFTGPTRLRGHVCRLAAVTPGTAYGEFASWLYVGVAGDVSLVCWDGTTVLFKAMPVGLYPIGSVMINSSGTTATTMLWGS